MGSEEVGTVPGTYRLMDLFCLREVLNQIMKCSCQSELGFAMYQAVEDSQPPTFHAVLDIVCRNCQQKVSFGTSVLTGKHEKKEMQSDVDARILRFFDLLELGGDPPGTGFQALWRDLYNTGNTSSSGPTEEEAADGPLVLDTTTSVVIGDHHQHHHSAAAFSPSSPGCPPRMVDFVTGCSQEQESIVICYSCHNIFTGAEFAVHETTACVKRTTTSANVGVSTEAPAAAVHPQSTGTGTPPDYPCTACGKVFTKLYNLKQHVRTHTGERPLQCGQCDKSFADRSSRNKHLRTVHELRRPHSCAACGKSFASTSHLNEHMAMHSKERKFVCHQCSRTFSFRASLKKHLASHSEDRPFQCHVCLKDFKARASVRAHMVRVHRLPLIRFNSEIQNS